MKFQGYTQYQTQIIELELRPRLKKMCFFWSNPHKIELSYDNFSHRNGRFTEFWSHDPIYNVT